MYQTFQKIIVNVLLYHGKTKMAKENTTQGGVFFW